MRNKPSNIAFLEMAPTPSMEMMVASGSRSVMDCNMSANTLALFSGSVRAANVAKVPGASAPPSNACLAADNSPSHQRQSTGCPLRLPIVIVSSSPPPDVVLMDFLCAIGTLIQQLQPLSILEQPDACLQLFPGNNNILGRSMNNFLTSGHPQLALRLRTTDDFLQNNSDRGPHGSSHRKRNRTHYMGRRSKTVIRLTASNLENAPPGARTRSMSMGSGTTVDIVNFHI